MTTLETLRVEIDAIRGAANGHGRPMNLAQRQRVQDIDARMALQLPKIAGHYTVTAEPHRTFLGAFKTTDELGEWLEGVGESGSVVRVPKMRLHIVDPTGNHCVGCAERGCGAVFAYVPARRSPHLCIEHAEESSRELDGWTPENSTD